MLWHPDQNVANWARLTMPKLPTAPLPQFAGNTVNLHNWAKKGWLNNSLPAALPNVSSPTNIIQSFVNHDWLIAVTLVANWGNMKRTKASIMGASSPTQNHRNYVSGAVQTAWNQIQSSHQQNTNWTINNAWQTFTGGGPNQLNWTSVMTSKTLHFMVRALGVINNPPVPLDNAITRQLLWPQFIARTHQLRNLHNYNGFTQKLPNRSLSAYQSYMTAIEIWSQRQTKDGVHNWSTTDVETTIFALLMKNPILTWI